MSVASKKVQHKPVRVAPTLTDPNMKNTRGPAELLLNDELGDNADQETDRETVFGGSSKTKEEQDAATPAAEPALTSTALFLIFGLVVIALIALIVWMVMKQTNDKKDEEELKRVIQPTAHPRNNMPPNYGSKQHPQMNPAEYEMHQRNMAAMHQQQQEMQQEMAVINNGADKKRVSFADAVDTREQTDASQDVKHAMDANTDKPKFSKKNPHPDIIRPGVPAPTESDVDDIIAQTSAALNKKPKATEAPIVELTDLDKALLDKVHDNTEDEDESESETD
jgi:hypothetical protein